MRTWQSPSIDVQKAEGQLNKRLASDSRPWMSWRPSGNFSGETQETLRSARSSGSRFDSAGDQGQIDSARPPQNGRRRAHRDRSCPLKKRAPGRIEQSPKRS